MKVRTVKDVDEETWRIFKEMASRRKLKMGSMLREIAREYRRRPSDSWDRIINTKPILTSKEAEGIIRLVKRIRKEHGYRDFGG